jgi:chemotaxis methyl-accepting protein methylase
MLQAFLRVARGERRIRIWCAGASTDRSPDSLPWCSMDAPSHRLNVEIVGSDHQ